MLFSFCLDLKNVQWKTILLFFLFTMITTFSLRQINIFHFYSFWFSMSACILFIYTNFLNLFPFFYLKWIICAIFSVQDLSCNFSLFILWNFKNFRIAHHFPSEFLRILLKVESSEFQVYDLISFSFSYSDFEFQHNND